jgi:hypothetical protein
MTTPRPPESPRDMPQPAQPTMRQLTPLAALLDEVARQVAPEYQGLSELLVNFREKPTRSDVARALFRGRKLVAVLEEAQRQMIARGMLPAEGAGPGARPTPPSKPGENPV